MTIAAPGARFNFAQHLIECNAGRAEKAAFVDDLRAGRLDHDIPAHGTLIRVRRVGTLHAPKDEVARQRAECQAARDQRAQEAK